MTATIRVLLVDDHPIVRAGLRAVLDSFPDISVVGEAEHGRAALDYLAGTSGVTDGGAERVAGGSGAHHSLNESRADSGTAPVDVVVMDIQMPVMDGITATKNIAAQGGPPVLILTTFDTTADIVAAVKGGALGYLLKDAPASAVHQAIVDTAAGKTTLSPDILAALTYSPANVELSEREVEINRSPSRYLFQKRQ